MDDERERERVEAIERQAAQDRAALEAVERRFAEFERQAAANRASDRAALRAERAAREVDRIAREAAEHRSAEDHTARIAERIARQAADRKTAAADQRAAAADQRAAASDQRAAASDQRAAEALAGQEADRIAREEGLQLRSGTYYSSLLQVWMPSTRNVAEYCTFVRFEQLFRTTVPKAVYYEQIVAGATETANFVAIPSSRPSTTSAMSRELWPTDIFGKYDPTAEVAHLIPAANTHATMYGDVAGWALSFAPRGMLVSKIWDLYQRAVHGARKEVNGSRIDHTGLKHSPSNKIRVKDQKQYLDNNPFLIIVPAMNLVDVLNWDGKTGYDALVMAEAWANQNNHFSIENVCNHIGMNEKGPVAEVEKIELARQLLESVIYGLGYSLKLNNRPPLEEKLENLFAHYQRPFDPDRMGGIAVPTMVEGDHVPRVRKIRLGPPALHPPPDPLLLTVKAAVVWSKRHGQPLLAGGEEQDDDVDDRDGFSQQALDDYVDWWQDDIKPKSMEELAAGLGQPHG